MHSALAIVFVGLFAQNALAGVIGCGGCCNNIDDHCGHSLAHIDTGCNTGCGSTGYHGLYDGGYSSGYHGGCGCGCGCGTGCGRSYLVAPSARLVRGGQAKIVVPHRPLIVHPGRITITHGSPSVAVGPCGRPSVAYSKGVIYNHGIGSSVYGSGYGTGYGCGSGCGTGCGCGCSGVNVVHSGCGCH